MSEVEGLALLPHLTESELAVLLGAVDAMRLRRMMEKPSGSNELRVLWSLSTAVSEALISAMRDGRRRRQDATSPPTLPHGSRGDVAAASTANEPGGAT